MPEHEWKPEDHCDRCDRTGFESTCSAGTVEDGHAALAKEMREAKTLLHRGDLSPSHFTEWAARVEQLGREAQAIAQREWGVGYREAQREREAREAEIAKVREDNVRLREAMLEIAEGIYKWGSIAGSKSLDFMADKLREAARLGGAE